MAKIIEADVIQKIATEAQWLTQTRIPYKGQIMIVSDSTGKVVNMKVGDGVNPFSDLNYMFDFENSQRISAVAPGALPTPTEANTYMVVNQVGDYTFGGSTIASITQDGYQATLWWTGSTWVSNGTVRVKGDMPDIANEIVFGGEDATSQAAVYSFISEIGGSYGDKNITAYTTDFPGASLTVLYSKIFDSTESINNSLIYSPVAGKIMLKTFSKSGSVVTMYQSKEVTLSVGVNEVNWGLVVPSGGMIGYSCNGTTLTGRVGFNTSSTRADIHILTSDSNNFTLPAKSSSGSIGLYIEYGNTGLLPRVSDLESKINDISGNDITNDFTPQLGGVTPNYSSNPDYMTLAFTTGNQSVIALGTLPNNEETTISFSAKTLADSISVVIGQFSSTLLPPVATKLSINATENKFTIPIKGGVSGGISIGVLAADNTGKTVLIKDFKIISQDSIEMLDYRLSELEQAPMPRSFNTNNALYALSRYDKKLTTVCFEGDSLFANPTGGAIPSVEPLTQRPIRLGQSNNLARRFYDYFSWNKPQWRRLDDSAWTKSGWTTINTTALFEPTYSDELYHTASGVAEGTITIPSGNENFALVYRVGNTSGNIEVYVNNVLRTTLSTNKTGGGHTGNPYKVYHIDNLGAGDNVIKIVRSGSNPIYVWGGFYWTGNTMVVMNVAHGGHTLAQLLSQHIDDEVVDNNFDSIIFEHTLMNDTARMADSGNTIEASVSALTTILDTKINGKEILMMSCQPYGTDPQDGTPNYYTLYPGMEDMKNALKKVVYDKSLPYIDIFDIFKKKIENRGGTLNGGQGGLWYTWDGQHQNEEGMREFWNMIKSSVYNIPLKQ